MQKYGSQTNVNYGNYSSPELIPYLLAIDQKVLKFNKVHMITHRYSGLYILKMAL